MLRTVVASHFPPRTVAMPRPFRAAAISRSDLAPGGLRPLGDHRALLLSQGGVQVQQERLDVGAQLGDEERRLLGHQPADEMHVTGQSIKLGDGDRGGPPVAASCRQEMRRAAVSAIG
jgi:hypothetical protein